MDSERLRTTALGFLLAFVVLGVLGWLVGIEDVVAILRGANTDGVVLVALLAFGWVAVWGLGIRDVLQVFGTPVSSWTGVLLSAGAGFANNITPFGHAGGEPLTALLIVDRTSVPYERGLAAMATVDTVNFVPSVAFALLGLAWLAVEGTVGDQLTVAAGFVVLMAVVIPAVGVWLWRRRSGLATRLAGSLETVFRWLASIIPQLTAPNRAVLTSRIDGFVSDLERIAESRRTLLAVLGYSAVGWLFQLSALWVAFEAIGSPIPLTAALVAVPIASVASALPLPGGAGGIESVLVGLLVATPLSTVSPTVAVAGVVLFRGFVFWVPTALGGVVFADSAVRRRHRKHRG